MDQHRTSHGPSGMPPPLAPAPAPKRGSWSILLPFLIFVIIAGAWCGFWFYTADKANGLIAGWLDREAKLGRVYGCGEQSLGGFPFRIEVRCNKASAEFRNIHPPRLLSAADILVASQIYQPTLLISEITSPVVVAAAGTEPEMTANWTLAQASLRGHPRTPERISFVVENPTLDRKSAAGPERMLEGEHIELHARMSGGTAKDHPVIDLVLRLAATSAPGIHSLATQPIDADIDSTLRGLSDAGPKPWPVRFREIHDNNGSFEIRAARVKQGGWLLTGAGILRLNENGRLNGDLRITVAGLDKLLEQLGVDYMSRSTTGSEKLGAAFNALDKIAPGLGSLARERAAPALAAGAVMLGEQTELEGRKAVALPLKFDDGKIYLGPLQIGQIAALF